MDILILVAVLGLWALVVVLWWANRGSDRGQDTASSTALVPVEPEDGIETKEVDDAVELWWPGGTRLATIRTNTKPTTGAILRSPWTRRAVGSLLGRARRGSAPVAAGRYRVTFPPDLMSTMASGGSVDVVLGGGKGVAGLGGAAALGGPAMAVAAGAVVMSVAQQQRLDRTLAVIEKQLDLIIDRMRDDDLGRLDAAEALLGQLETRSAELPSRQLRSELAVVRQSVDSVYFARRRFAERLGDAIGDAQEAGLADSGHAQAWANGVLDAVGDPDQLRSELLVYLRSLVVRAQLATSTSAVLAIDGDLADANRLLSHTIEELRADFYALYRRFRPLAQWAPKRAMPWRKRDWDRAHQTVVEVFELMEGEVEPLLPEAQSGPLELDAVVGNDGELEEIRLVED